MSDAGEPIIHLKRPQETSVVVWLPQDHLDGLNQLLHWLDGVSDHGGKGRIPGHFELVMHYRTLRQAILKQESISEELSSADLISKCNVHPSLDHNNLKCSICDRTISDQWFSIQLEPTADRTVWCGGIDCVDAVATLWNKRNELCTKIE